MTWTTSARRTWQLNPGIAIHLTERFSAPALENEVTRLVRSKPLAYIDVPDALKFSIGDGLDPAFRRDLRVRIPSHIPIVLAHVRLAPLAVILNSTDYRHLNIDTATIHSSCTMRTVCWNNIPLILRSSSSLKSFKPYDMTILVRLSHFLPTVSF